MKRNVTLWDFQDAFKAIRPDNFSHEGLEVLYDWFIDLEDCDPGCEETELDVIAICCEFSESTPDEQDTHHEYGQATRLKSLAACLLLHIQQHWNLLRHDRTRLGNSYRIVSDSSPLAAVGYCGN